MFREIPLPSSGNVNDYVTLNRQVKIFLRKILLTSLLSLSLVNLVFIFNYFNIEIYELAVSCINSFYNKNMSYVCKKNLNPIQNGHFGGCSRMGGDQKAPNPKICQTYPTMMELGTVMPYVKKIQKIYQSRDTPPEFW